MEGTEYVRSQRAMIQPLYNYMQSSYPVGTVVLGDHKFYKADLFNIVRGRPAYARMPRNTLFLYSWHSNELIKMGNSL